MPGGSTKEFIRQRDALLTEIQRNRTKWPDRQRHVQHELVSPQNWIRWAQTGARFYFMGRTALKGLRFAPMLMRPGSLMLAAAAMGAWKMRHQIARAMPNIGFGHDDPRDDALSPEGAVTMTEPRTVQGRALPYRSSTA